MNFRDGRTHFIFTTFLALLSLLLPLGCSDEGVTAPSLVRLAAPSRIESMETYHLPWIRSSRIISDKDEVMVRLDADAPWFSFFWPTELSEMGMTLIEDLSDRELVKKLDDTLVLGPEVGIAQIVPVEKWNDVIVECIGDFGSGTDLKVSVVKLAKQIDFPPKSNPLRTFIKKFGVDTIRLEPAADGRSATGRIDIRDKTKALLVIVLATRKTGVAFQSATFAGMTPRHEMLMARKKEGKADDDLLWEPLLESTTRPSLLFSPGSSIAFHEMPIPENGRFRCALGAIGGLKSGVRFIFEAFSRDKNDLYIETAIKSGPESWIEIEHDLSSVSGKAVRIVLSCDREVEAAVSEKIGLISDPALLCCGSPMILSKTPDPETTPGWNLVLISLDTLRWDHLGCYGYDRPVSPFMDQFAKDNILFENAYAHAPFTLPSHASLFTSLYPSSHGAQDISKRLPTHAKTLAEILADAGWMTAAYNTGGNLSHEFGFNRGFDLYCEIDPLGDLYHNWEVGKDAKFADGTLGSLDKAFTWMEAAGDNRFFLFLHTFMIHEYCPPLDRAQQFNAGCTSELKPGLEAIKHLNHHYRNKERLEDEDLEFFVNMYDAGIRTADDMVRDVIDRLESLGIRDRTLVIITSDHGEEFHEHGSLRHSNTVYEEMIHIPLIMAVPGQDGKMRIETPVSHVDIVPTVLEFMNLDPPEILQGRSLIPLLDGKSAQNRWIYSEVNDPTLSHRTCLIMDGWKLVAGSTDPTLEWPARAEIELFMLDSDPDELKDLFDSGSPSPSRELEKRMDKLKRSFIMLRDTIRGEEEEKPSTISKDLEQLLKKHGYL